jgi:thiamine kinase-like enzyme
MKPPADTSDPASVPDLTSAEVQETINHILPRPVSVTAVRRLRHPGTGAVTRITTTEGNKYLLKSYPHDLRPSPSSLPFWDIESRNLALIDPVSTINKPRYYGVYENYFLMDYISGSLFQDLLDDGRLTLQEQFKLFRLAVEQLVAIHISASMLSDRRMLKRPFQPAKLERGLQASIKRIETVGFPAFERRGFKIDSHWRLALNQFPYEDVISNLNAARGYVVGHGDFKPNNLIITPDHRLFVIDWLGLGKAQPWYDLAYLLAYSPERQRLEHAGYYLEQMKNRGYLTGIEAHDAAKLVSLGSIYQELVRARSNERYIGLRKDPHHINEFTAALNGLAQLVLSKPTDTAKHK